MVLHLLLWTIRLAEIRRIGLDPEIRARASVAFEFLRTFVDAESGHTPNFGSNDGSHILPLSGCEHGDYRPLLRLGACVLGRPSALPSGAWDEAALWMCGRVPNAATVDLPPHVSTATGYHRLGSLRSWAMVRAGRYRRRPFQADQLHVDLWWHGMNLARDAGTYLYNGPAPWDNGLAGSAVHNTVMVDGLDQMRRAGRFLWLDWAQATGRSVRDSGAEFADRFEGEHDGYRRLGVIHRRTVQCVDENAWIIMDDLLGGGDHALRLHWLAPDWPCEIVSQFPFCVALSGQQVRVRWSVFSSHQAVAGVIRCGKSSNGQGGADDSLLGWESPTYGELQPAISLLFRMRAPLPVRLVTVILAGDASHVRQEQNQVILECGDLRHRVSLSPDKSTD
jgi:hypothetical protein